LARDVESGAGHPQEPGDVQIQPPFPESHFIGASTKGPSRKTKSMKIECMKSETNDTLATL
jgi:hypothetical protein